jgi:hypothetical protein
MQAPGQCQDSNLVCLVLYQVNGVTGGWLGSSSELFLFFFFSPWGGGCVPLEESGLHGPTCQPQLPSSCWAATGAIRTQQCHAISKAILVLASAWTWALNALGPGRGAVSFAARRGGGDTATKWTGRR